MSSWAHGKPCWYCGKPANSRDHVIPQVKGGVKQKTPIVPACQTCNSLKGDRSVQEFRTFLVRAIAPRHRARPNYQAIEARAFKFYGELHPGPYAIARTGYFRTGMVPVA